MANNRPANENAVSNVNLSDELKKIAKTGFCTMGFTPVAAKFKLTESQLTEIIKNITAEFLSDVQTVTLDIDRNRGKITAFVWLPNRSPHVCDDSLAKSEFMPDKLILRYSKELKEYMEKFCDPNSRRTESAADNLPVVGIRVMIDRFLDIVFDKYGTEYSRRYGVQQVKTNLWFKPVFSKSNDDRPFGKFKYLEIDKCLATDRDMSIPRPRKSFNI